MWAKIIFFFCCIMLFVSCKTVPTATNQALLGSGSGIQFFKNKSCIIVYVQERDLYTRAKFSIEATYKIKKIHKKHWIISFYATQAEKDYLQELKNTDTVEYNYRKNLLPDGLQADYFPDLNGLPLIFERKHTSNFFSTYEKGFLVIKNKQFINNIYPYDCIQVGQPCQYQPHCVKDITLYSETYKNLDRHYGVSFDKLLRTAAYESHSRRFEHCDELQRWGRGDD